MEFHRVVWKNLLPIRPVLRGESMLLLAPNPWILLYSWFVSNCRPCRSIRILWKDRISCIDKVSFKIKDTFQWFATPIDPDRELLGACCQHKNTIIFLLNRSIQTLSSVCWITIYPVGCRDLYVVIKINTLERVSSLLEPVIYSTSASVDVPLSVRGAEDLSREWGSCGTGMERSDWPTVTVDTGKQRRHGHDPNLRPCRITQVCDNGAVQLVKVTDDNGGAVHETWNIRNVHPRRTWSLLCHNP